MGKLVITSHHRVGFMLYESNIERIYMAKYKKTKTEELEMAQRRMLSKDFTTSNLFLNETSIQAQWLYFQLLAETDNDGFVGNFNGVLRYLNAKTKWADELEKNGFIIRFPKSNCAVLVHFGKMNKIAPDRYIETEFQEEFSRLQLDENRVYHLVDDTLADGMLEFDKFDNKIRKTETKVVKETSKKDSKLEPMTF